jgi:Transcriptional regulatory protein, C terminal
VQFRFENHPLDADRRELRRGAELIAVEPQVFDLLLYLVQNRNRMVTKDDVIAGVWGGRIVSDSTLASRVNAARKAALDEARDRDAVGGRAQHRVAQRQRAQRRGREPGRNGGASEHERKRDRPPAHRDRRGRGRQRDRGPPGWLALGREVDRDAGAERDRQPRHQPAGRDLGGDPRRDAAGEPAGDVGEARRPRERAAALRPRPGASLRAPPIDHATPRTRATRSRNGRLDGRGGPMPAGVDGV